MEGNGGRRTLFFTISLSAASQQPVSLRWNTANGSAVARQDYLAGGGTVAFQPGQTTATVGVVVLGDRLREANETFFVDLSSAVNATISTTARRATGLIVNDDGLTKARLAAAFATMETFNRNAKTRT